MRPTQDGEVGASDAEEAARVDVRDRVVDERGDRAVGVEVDHVKGTAEV